MVSQDMCKQVLLALFDSSNSSAALCLDNLMLEKLEGCRGHRNEYVSAGCEIASEFFSQLHICKVSSFTETIFSELMRMTTRAAILDT